MVDSVPYLGSTFSRSLIGNASPGRSDLVRAAGPYTCAVHDSREQRLRRLAAEADRIAGLLVERGATLVVAFGSFARGDVARTSDLDIMAVMDSELPSSHA